jgi:hypothetical protein
MLELPGPYQIATTLNGRALLLQVRDHHVAGEAVIFDYEAYDVEEDCIFTPTPDQARAIWNVLMADLETICQA